MPILNFGQKLALLKEAWDFPINKELAYALSGERSLDTSTVHRWAKGAAGPRPEVLEETARRLAVYLDEKGVLKRAGIDRGRLEDALLGEDLKFIDLIAQARHERLPVPAVFQQPQASPKLNYVEKSLTGRMLLYRLGHEAEQKKGRTGGMEMVLRRVPANIEREGNLITYKEEYFGAKSAGFVMFIDQFITIYGEDWERAGFSELFFMQIVSRPDGDGLFRGIVSMMGDLGAPTAYRMLLRRAPERDSRRPWDEFVQRYERTIAIGEEGMLADEVEEETGFRYEEYVKRLRLGGGDVELQAPEIHRVPHRR